MIKFDALDGLDFAVGPEDFQTDGGFLRAEAEVEGEVVLVALSCSCLDLAGDGFVFELDPELVPQSPTY